MVDSLRTKSAFLGAGGLSPGVDLFHMTSGETKRLLTLPAGNSIYALDVSSERGSLAAGTKSGLLYWIVGVDNTQDPEESKMQAYVQGAPILSVCFINKSLLAVSDTSGRCLLWKSHKNVDVFGELPTGKGMVCSLLKLSEEELVGLSSEGELLFWKMPEGSLVRNVPGKAPSSLCALVSMVYWRGEHSLVWPGTNGQLVLYDIEKDDLRYVPAHAGDFYAITGLEDYLLTIGIEDSLAKLWRTPSDDKAFRELKASERVIFAHSQGCLQHGILLINDQGDACISVVEKDRLRVRNRASKGDYRTAWGMPIEELRQFYDRERDAEARRLQAEIKTKMEHGQHKDLNELHSELVRLGYRHVSLALRAEQARRRGDIVDEVKIRSELVRRIPINNPSSYGSIERYAALLEKVWQIEAAQSIREQTADAITENENAIQREKLSKKIEALKGDEYVIEADLPIEALIEASTVLRTAFTGRFLIKALCQTSRDVRITSEQIVEKYEQLRREKDKRSLPRAQGEKVWWISQTTMERIELVTVGDEAKNGIKNLQFGLKVFCDAFQTVVVPVTIFDARSMEIVHSVEEHNGNLMEALQTTKNRTESNSWLSIVHRAMMATVGRLVNSTLAERSDIER